MNVDYRYIIEIKKERKKNEIKFSLQIELKWQCLKHLYDVIAVSVHDNFFFPGGFLDKRKRMITKIIPST